MDVLEEDPKRRRRIFEDAWRARNPWIRAFKTASQRCNNPKNVKYKYYGGRGIKFMLTLPEVKVLWIRDRAYNMSYPSIDRKHSDKNYTFKNCRFIELRKNRELGWKRLQKAVISTDADMNTTFYISLRAAARKFCPASGDTGNIRSCLRGDSHTAYGLTWKYYHDDSCNNRKKAG
jgi:hypothetical protein